MGLVRFRLFGAQVEIRPGFWFVLAVLGLSSQRSPVNQFILAVTLFVTILGHELGHAYAAKAAGLEPFILIHAFGGATNYAPKAVLSRGTAIRITMAGPVGGLLLTLIGLSVWKLGPYVLHHPWSSRIEGPLLEYVQINGVWSLINLLPITPFDGGQILSYLFGPTRQIIAARISLAFGVLAALLLYRIGLSVAAVVFLVASILQFLAAKRVQTATSPTISPRQMATLLEKARSALSEGDHDSAIKLARVVVEVTSNAAMRRSAAEVYAWAALGKNQPSEARQALVWMSDSAVDPLLQSALLEADGDVERAVTCLRQARVMGDERPQVAASLVRLLLLVDRFGEAALTTIQILDDVTVEEARQVVRACREGGRPVPAAKLAEALFGKTGHVSDLLTCVYCYQSAGNGEAARSTLALALGDKLTPDDIESSGEWNALAEVDELVSVLSEARVVSAK
jgi:Zn-dependent protease